MFFHTDCKTLKVYNFQTARNFKLKVLRLNHFLAVNFADDNIALSSSKSKHETKENLEAKLNLISKWPNYSGLKVNASPHTNGAKQY